MVSYRYERVHLKGSPSSAGTDVEWLSIPIEERQRGGKVTGQRCIAS